MNWLLAGLIAVAALGIGYIGKSWQEGQQAKIDLQAAREAHEELMTSLQAAATEAETLRGKMGEISNDLEAARNANAARATTSRTQVRTIVSNTPTLAAGRLPADFVRLFNDTRSPRDVTGAAAAGADAGHAAPVPGRSATPDRGRR
jgi:hypothetical protein